MEIKRDLYLEQLKIRKDNGMIKIITGIRRCGKSFLLFVLFKKYLLESGVDNDHIIDLAYAPEIASVMLQRQQASAIIDARKMIVDGAVGMVEMALEELNKKQVEYLLSECVRQRKKDGKYVSEEIDVPPELDIK